LDDAVDRQGKLRANFDEAERHFKEAERYWNKIEKDDPVRRFNARVQHKLPTARQLFLGCMDQFQSLTSTARLYRELALVEHLAERQDLANAYEEEGLKRQGQLGISERLPSYNCYLVIERLKREEKWSR